VDILKQQESNHATQLALIKSFEGKQNNQQIVEKGLLLKEQNEIDMVKALSLSEQEEYCAEDVLIQNILEISKTGSYAGGNGVAYGNISSDAALDGDETLNIASSLHTVEESDQRNGELIDKRNDGDLKMPAS